MDFDRKRNFHAFVFTDISDGALFGPKVSGFFTRGVCLIERVMKGPVDGG